MNVLDLLQSKDIPYIPKGADYLISCLNPEHPDRNPSMRVDQVTGIFNCFSCEYKGNLFTHFGEKANQLQIRRELLKKKIAEKRAESIGLSFPENAVDYTGEWRGISKETYATFEAFESTDPEFINRIVFPIRDTTGKIAAFIGRHTAMGTPKYLNSPRGAKMPLYPKVKPQRGSIMLVEGIYDMLNLHDKGLTNAVCCFGVKNVNEDKLSILSMQGVDSIDVFFDNDEAGKSGASKIKTMCDTLGLNCRVIQFGNKELDAGALTYSQVRSLKKKLYE